MPQSFINYVFKERKALIEKMIEGRITKEEMLVGFTRHTPAVVSYGPAGLNASIKGVGLVVKEEYLSETVERLRKVLERGLSMVEALKVLLDVVYREDRVDLTRLSTIELAKKHTWTNVQRNPSVTLLFYTPPNISYEVRCRASIHLNDYYWEFVNAVHDLFHGGKVTRDWSKYPVYIFEIVEVYDNSPSSMGIKIY